MEPDQFACDAVGNGTERLCNSITPQCVDSRGTNLCKPSGAFACSDFYCEQGQSCEASSPGSTFLTCRGDNTYPKCGGLDCPAPGKCVVGGEMDGRCIRPELVACDGNGDGVSDAYCDPASESCEALPASSGSDTVSDTCVPLEQTPCDGNGDGIARALCDATRPNCLVSLGTEGRDVCEREGVTACDGNNDGTPTEYCDANFPVCLELDGVDRCAPAGYSGCDGNADGTSSQACADGLTRCSVFEGEDACVPL